MPSDDPYVVLLGQQVPNMRLALERMPAAEAAHLRRLLEAVFELFAEVPNLPADRRQERYGELLAIIRAEGPFFRNTPDQYSDTVAADMAAGMEILFPLWRQLFDPATH